MHDLFAPLLEWYRGALENGGYLMIVLLMAIESSFMPLPSELVIPFAAHYAQTRGHLSLGGVVLAGAFGSWLGATVMYWASRWAGRPLVLKVSAALETRVNQIARRPLLARLASHVIITPEKIEKAERWAAQFGRFGIFASRLLPVVRHLIGIPAGIVRMNYLTFSIFTLIGSTVWCTVLAWVGVKAGQDEQLVNGNFGHLALWVGGGVAVLGVIYYFFVHRQMRAQTK